MTKLLDTTDDAKLIFSLADILTIPAVDVRKYFTSNMRILRDVSEVSNVDINHFFGYVAGKRGQLKLSFNEVIFEQVSINHLTTRIGVNNPDGEPLYNLVDALVNETCLKEFLQSNGLEFKENQGKLQTYYNKVLVNWDDYCNDDNKHSVGMIKRRFAGSKNVSQDKCVNGFLFSEGIHEHSDVKHILYGPEIMQDMCRVLCRTDILSEWRQQRKIFSVNFKADISKVIFDYNDRLNNKQKIFRIYRYIINYFSKQLFGQLSDYDNPIIRLKDTFSVPTKDIMSFREIDV
ncbi:hypothetical protein BK121_26770 [Paenibacillus odorifer]|uniref:hypothetical protein n=1 Tax=Paenibacillus TaxID=44249 RepID=UPI00096F0FFF|nr:hypothetical protein [Paenibacillus odorifer]OMC63536.1 hypothetical protein BK121_26770 [Paenibacillus odorifer]